MAYLETDLQGLAKRQGKVRDLYDLGDRLLLVATDRISAFDWVLPTGIPDKGRVLTTLSAFWFNFLDVPNHLISIAIEDVEAGHRSRRSRSVAGPVDAGQENRVWCRSSAWSAATCPAAAGKSTAGGGSVCGIPLPPGLVESDRIEPIFTPATKAETGHDENVSFEVMASAVGTEVAGTLRALSLEVYNRAAARASTAA